MNIFWAFAKKPNPEGQIKRFCSDSVNSKLVCVVTSGEDSDVGRLVFGNMCVVEFLYQLAWPQQISMFQQVQKLQEKFCVLLLYWQPLQQQVR
ncbi:hypothetical protein BYT27DRAFT_7184137, partial [Phlegmacium glaucopus]